MSAAGGRHWAAINESSFVAGMRLLFWVCRVFGRWPFRIVLYPVLAWYVLAKPAARRASSTYLDHVRAFAPAPSPKASSTRCCCGAVCSTPAA